jgi:nitrite reductase/ring-hydroxylating ferredoxin subunit/uncharacterized membrane protein
MKELVRETVLGKGEQPPSSAWRTIGERIEKIDLLDEIALPLRQLADRVLPRGPKKDLLHGTWLGHPLHPVLTDLPIGFWTSALTLDFIPGKSSRRTATVLVGLGVASAAPTALAGWADWTELSEKEKRAGVVHALANTAAIGLYSLSFIARLRKRRFSGFAFGLAGATVATAGAYLGGHLTFRRAAGVSHSIDAPQVAEWTPVQLEGTLNAEKPTAARLRDEPIAAVLLGSGPAAVYGVCSHAGGPLAEGDMLGACVRCPWHGSTFSLEDGSVVRGPATMPQPAYEMRLAGGRTEARSKDV